jgi:hypothetical protein
MALLQARRRTSDYRVTLRAAESKSQCVRACVHARVAASGPRGTWGGGEGPHRSTRVSACACERRARRGGRKKKENWNWRGQKPERRCNTYAHMESQGRRARHAHTLKAP